MNWLKWSIEVIQKLAVKARKKKLGVFDVFTGFRKE